MEKIVKRCSRGLWVVGLLFLVGMGCEAPKEEPPPGRTMPREQPPVTQAEPKRHELQLADKGRVTPGDGDREEKPLRDLRTLKDEAHLCGAEPGAICVCFSCGFSRLVGVFVPFVSSPDDVLTQTILVTNYKEKA